MTSTNDVEKDLLGPADPARTQAPPARGSARYTAILETAMSQTDLRPATAPSPGPARSTRRRWIAVPLAAAAAAVAIGVAAGTGRNGDAPVAQAPSAASMVLVAATNTAATDTLRAVVRVTHDGITETTTGEFAGDDAVVEETEDGVRTRTTIVDGTTWTTEDGTTREQPASADDGLAPFAASARAVLDAAVTGSGARQVGTTTIGGAEATHFRVDLTTSTRQALAALTPGQLAWFDLESPELASGIDVWVADGLIRRIDVESSRGPGTSASTEFSDFGADITITAPKTP